MFDKLSKRTRLIKTGMNSLHSNLFNNISSCVLVKPEHFFSFQLSLITIPLSSSIQKIQNYKKMQINYEKLFRGANKFMYHTNSRYLCGLLVVLA